MSIFMKYWGVYGAIMMDENKNRRREDRLQYKWPVWFAENFEQTLSEGLMVDVSSGGLAFVCNADEDCPQVGQRLTARFSIPRSEQDDPSDMTSFTRIGRVLRVDIVNTMLRQVAIQFEEPLSLKPCEQACIDMMHSKSLKQ
jgi:hypothetical protein